MNIISNDDITLSKTTTNSNLIDDWNETEDYFEGGNGNWYESNNEVMKAAFETIIENDTNNELLMEFLD